MQQTLALDSLIHREGSIMQGSDNWQAYKHPQHTFIPRPEGGKSSKLIEVRRSLCRGKSPCETYVKHTSKGVRIHL